MFTTLKQKVLVIIYVVVILSIPVGTYLISQSQTTKSKASEPRISPSPVTKATLRPTVAQSTPSSSLSELDSALKQLLSPAPTPSSSVSLPTAFGPTLSLKIAIEGRPANNQSGKVFVGIMEGDLVQNPRFLLNFLVDVPQSGQYDNLSIAGLNPGSKYTALLKGTTQIATSSAFIMSPITSKLNGGESLNLTSGDLNEDNIINTADYSLAQSMLGSTPGSQKWNENADFNKDSVFNIFDSSIVLKNLGKIGASGSWASPIPTATPSASLIEGELPVGSVGGSSSGYWMWVPK